ncbi:hypothetical protein GGR52DRAFT_555372 [Hypoxylon sp. FL1284]|nr:hypothetical protein GGR52DRAFT_555372 [Hypoxylon sp. FL1284]
MAEQSQDLRFRDSYPSLDNNAWTLSGLAIVLVALRIWCRCNANRRLWWDDCFLVIALMLIVADAAIFSVLLNQPYKANDTLLPTRPQTVLYLGIFRVLNALSQAFSKTSIVAIFLRLTSGFWKIALYISISVLDAILLGQTFMAWVQDCDVTFNQAYRLTSKCIFAGEVWFLNCLVPALSFFFDIFLAVLPWKIIKRLPLERYEKIGLAMSMSLGVIVGGAALARLIVWMRLDSQPTDYQLRYQFDLILWNFIEPAVSIIAASLPMLRGLVADLRRSSNCGFIRRIFRPLRGNLSRSRNAESLELDVIPSRETVQKGETQVM